MSEWELWHADVKCPGCGRGFRYIVQHPPIPRIVRSFHDDEGRPVGDDCPYCFEALPVPEPEIVQEGSEWVVRAAGERLKGFASRTTAEIYVGRIR